MLLRIAVFFLWLLHFLPLPILARLGQGLGWLFYHIGGERRRVGHTNLQLCFPQWGEDKRQRVLCQNFQSLTRSLLEHGILWWSSKQRILRLVKIEGLEHYTAVKDRPVIWLAPHFVGLDMGGIRLTIDYPLVSIYSRQKHPLFDRLLQHGRTRFGPTRLFSRQAGVRPIVSAMKEGLPFYYLPDQDFGARDSLFIPFFGVPTATITGLTRLARATHAVIVPCVTQQLPGGKGYTLKFYPAWEQFPGESIEADTRRMNAFIEEMVLDMPEQYFWLHKRFKTRPVGEVKFY